MTLLTLTFELEVDEAGHKAYLETWPDFAEETIEETITRETLAALEFEGLISGRCAVNGKVIA